MSKASNTNDYHAITISEEVQAAFDDLQAQAWAIFCTAYKKAYVAALKYLDRDAAEPDFHPWFTIGNVIASWTPEAVSIECVLRWKHRCIDELVNDGVIEYSEPSDFPRMDPRYRLI